MNNPYTVSSTIPTTGSFLAIYTHEGSMQVENLWYSGNILCQANTSAWVAEGKDNLRYLTIDTSPMKYRKAVSKCQRILAGYLPPDSNTTQQQVISKLIAVLDDKELLR